ncbi:MAG: prepilin-type N-terminal cleavage/methylation domain-containing protein, partial [Turicibacter sanguinis]
MENKKSYLHKNPGLTLIEVIISVALLAILSVPIFTMVNTNVKLSQKTELRQQATIIGQR